MTEMLLHVISNPLAAIGALVVLIALLSLFFHFYKPSVRFLLFLELLWLVIGSLGVVFLVNENSKYLHQLRIDEIENEIKSNYRSAFMENTITSDWCARLLDESIATTNYEEQLFNQEFCKWLDTAIDDYGLAAKDELIEPIRFPSSLAISDEQAVDIKLLREGQASINKLIEKRNELVAQDHGEVLEIVKFTLGILLLIFAFAIRISITIYKLRKEG